MRQFINEHNIISFVQKIKNENPSIDVLDIKHHPRTLNENKNFFEIKLKEKIGDKFTLNYLDDTKNITKIACNYKFAFGPITTSLHFLENCKNIKIYCLKSLSKDKYGDKYFLKSFNEKIIFFDDEKIIEKQNTDSNPYPLSEFIEISPVDFEIENTPRKELSSVPLAEVKFPKIVYIIVGKKIELEIKLLKDFPEWDFLPSDDLNRKTIEIFFDLNIAKRSCNKEQKVLKVPNTDVFRIASRFLVGKGISRIVCAENLIAL